MVPFRVVLTTTDFSDASKPALVMAAELARLSGAALHVLHAEDVLLREAARQSGVEFPAESQRELAAFFAAAVPGSVVPQVHVETGGAVDVILEAATQLGADVIVLGSHGMSGVERVVFGSTAEAVVRRSSVPVLVVPYVDRP